MSDTPEPPSSEIDALVTQAIDLVNKGSISLSQVLKALAPPEERLPVPTKLPLPAVITDAQKAALDKLPTVFGKVVPTERRELAALEIKALWDERQTLDEIGKLAENRKASIRTALFNHFDVMHEQSVGSEGLIVDAEFDKDGHYKTEATVPIPDSGMVFRREVTEGAPTVPLAALTDALEAGEITKREFLEMTRQTRVVDEHKVMGVLKKNPKLIHVLAKRATPGKKTAAFWPRPEKQ